MVIHFSIETTCITDSGQKVNCVGFAQFVLLGIFSRMNSGHSYASCRQRLVEWTVIVDQKSNKCG